jgi:hypothetical protein
MINPNTLGIVYWNTWYHAEPRKQLEHLRTLEEQLRQRQAGSVVLCLSEATHTSRNDGLVDLLKIEGYSTAHRTTSILERGREECLAIASRDVPLYDDVNGNGSQGSTRFTELVAKRGIRNFKRRWHAALQLGNTATAADFKIATAHLSTIRPSNEELTRSVSLGNAAVYGGDFNTLVSDRYVRTVMSELDMVKLEDPSIRATVPLFPWGRSRLGWELDHVLVAEAIADQSTLKVSDRGPSNHRPLLVTVPLLQPG